MDMHDSEICLRCVMDYFHCNEEMARIIIKSSKENGEFSTIKNMCMMRPDGKENNDE